MSTADFHFELILLVALVSVITASCLCSISCPCGNKANEVYTQCINNSFHEKYTCERWANCMTCEANTNYCITCPPGRSGPTCAEALDPRANCPDPGDIQNGYRRLVNGIPTRTSRIYSNGHFFQYFCNEGYELQGNNELICLTSGKWSTQTPWCQRLPIDPSPYCSEPGQIPYGSYRNSGDHSTTSQRYAVGESVIYYCQNGYDLVGSEMITCMPSGSWPMKPMCRRTKSTSERLNPADSSANCPDPGSIQNGYRRLMNGFPSKLTEIYNIGETFQYFCNEGYELQGKNTLTCLTSGKWTSNKPRCQGSSIGLPGSYCLFPEINLTGMIITPRGQKFPPGTEMEFDCEDGYKLEGNEFIIYCSLNGEWSPKPPTCRRKSTSEATPPFVTPIACPMPTVDPNGDMEESLPIDPRRRRQGFEAGSQVSFTCRSGYQLSGTNTITCLIQGQWTSNSPTCIRISGDLGVCTDPGSIQHGGVIVHYNNPNARSRSSSERDSYPEGTELIFDCNNGYRLEGERKLNCMSTGSWSGDKPRCIKDCGRSILPPGSKITHGRSAQEGEFPWMVLISTNDSETFAGILLDHTTVLTVAHNFENVRQCKLHFFKLNRTNSIDDRYVDTRFSSQIIIHPEYNSKTYDNDIAIVKFSTDISYSVNVEPICAPTPDSSARNIVPGQTGYLIGWNFVKDNQKLPGMMVAPLPIKETQTCLRDSQRRNQLLKITPGMFCAGFTDDQKRTDACYEGSGAALVFYNSEMGRFTVEGLASHRAPGRCNEPENHIIFMKVSNYVQWILQYLEK